MNNNHTNFTLSEGDIEELAVLVKPYLTEKRYLHTLAVAKEAEKIGRIYMPEKICELMAAALLHDITKKEELKKQLHYCEEFDIIVKEFDHLSPKVFHAKTAAKLASRDFARFVNDEIANGIRWHTTGRFGMSDFEAIVYLADYIEESRDFEDCVLLRNYFYGRIAEGDDKREVLVDTMIYSFDLTIKNLLSEGALVDDDTIGARNYYLIHKSVTAPKLSN